ncbi:MAG: hypothetical protein ACK5NA_03445 [Enterococcus sp.]
MTEVKRKHFRFPVCADDECVKLDHHQYQESLTNEKSLSKTAEKSYGLPESFDFTSKSEHAYRRNQAKSVERKNQFKEQTEYRPNKLNLPQYGRSTRSKPTERPTPPKKNLFGSRKENVASARPTTSNFSAKREPVTQTVQTKNHSTSTSIPNTHASSVTKKRSYFVPKYIPASILPDEQVEDITANELFASMKKETQSYLLFTTEAEPVKEVKKATVTKKKTGKTVTQSTTKNTASEKTATAVKKPKKNHMILDKSLQGLIDQEQDSLKENSYFK